MTNNFIRMCSNSILLLAVLVLQSACAPVIKAPLEERRVLTVRQQSDAIGGQLIRVVQAGNTLHGIAFEYNLDVNELAAWNNIVDTSRLSIGHRIRLTPPIGFTPEPATRSEPVQVARNQQPRNNAVVILSPQESERELLRPPASVGLKPGSKAIVDKNVKPVDSRSTGKTIKNANVSSWKWPLRGDVIRRFSPTGTQQGIDILGDEGQDVRASASGEVVYIGDSLKGYGNLIIIKHNDTYLSAYAHNQRILVTEGQVVSSNQVIGSVGINNRRESALHFQIRREGKPVNPMAYLSER